MNLLSLGTSDRALFAIHEPAVRVPGRPRAAVICNPLGDEYIYAHRSIRHLAIRLARRGFHTVRFDYFGSGDSGGESSQMSLQGMESDVRCAIEAARDIAGCASVALIGLRVGANIAARVAVRHAAEIESIVAWDPIVSGAEYVQQLSARAPGAAGAEPESTLVRELRTLELPAPPTQLRERSLLLVTVPEEPDAAAAATSEDPGLAGWPVRAAVPAPICWVEAATTTGALPVAIIRRIEEWLP